MKKLLTIAFAMLLGASLSFAQAAGGAASTDKTGTGKSDSKTTTSSSTKGGKKGTKTGAKKKGKKSTGGTTTPAPK